MISALALLSITVSAAEKNRCIVFHGMAGSHLSFEARAGNFPALAI
jgi:hypothetical protein